MNISDGNKKIGYYLRKLKLKAKNFYWLNDKGYNDKELKKFAKQREKYGFDERECFELSYTFAYYIYPRLKKFSIGMQGCPADLTMKEWKQIVEDILWSFENTVNSEFEEHISNNEKDTEFWNKMNHGLELFAKYFFAFWE